MKQKPSFLAIIPARCGSKGLPGKNLLPLKNKPLLAWSIETGLNSSYATKTVVSSDCEKILNIAKEYGAYPLLRPEALARDSSPSEPLVQHALEYFKHKGELFDYAILLQPTSPLRTAKDLDDAIETLLNNNADALISVYEPEHSPYKAFRVDERGYLRGLIDDKTPFMRRQELPLVYMPNGAIYIVQSHFFLQQGKFFSQHTIPYVMSNEKSVDIDDLKDFERAEKILESME